MIPWLTTGNFLKGLIHYNEDKEQKNDATLIYCNTFDGDINTFKFLYKEMTEGTRKQKTLMHVSLNFHEKDKEKLSHEQYIKIAEDFLISFGFPLDQPYLIYEHTDKNHPHIHMAIPMAMTNGEWINMRQFPARRMIKIARTIEKKYGLTEVTEGENLTVERTVKNKEYQLSKQAVEQLVNTIMNERPASYEEIQKLAERYNVQYNGVSSSLSFEVSKRKNGITFFLKDAEGQQLSKGIKGSQLPGGYSFAQIQDKLSLNAQLKDKRLEKVRACVLDILDQYEGIRYNAFKTLLEKENVLVQEYLTKTGEIFGVDFTDSITGIRFKGSELDKQLSWNKLKGKLDLTAEPQSVQPESIIETKKQQSKPTDTMARPSEIIKSNFSLIDFIERQGYVHNKKKDGSNYKHYSLEKEVLLVYNHSKTSSTSGLYYTNPNDDRDKGDIINFVINKGIVSNMNEAIKYFLNDDQQYKQTPTPTLKPSSEVPAYKEKQPFKSIRMEDLSSNDFIIVDRGIALDIVDKKFNGAVFTTTHENLYEDLKALYGNAVHKHLDKLIKPVSNYTVFPMYNIENGQLVGQQVRHKDFDHLVVNSDKSNSIWHNYDPSKNAIAVFENPIDAISHQQLFPQSDLSYFGTIGNPSNRVVDHVANLSKTHSLMLAGDNDEAGQFFNTRFIARIVGNLEGSTVNIGRSNENIKFSITSDNPQKHLLALNHIADKLGRKNFGTNNDISTEGNTVTFTMTKNRGASFNYTNELKALNENIIYFYAPNIKTILSKAKDFNQDLQNSIKRTPTQKPKL